MLKQDYLAVNATTPTLVNYENYGIQEANKMHVIIKNVNPDHSVYIGDKNVTSSGGSLEITKGSTFEIDLTNADALYCITETGSFQITIIKVLGWKWDLREI